MSQLLEECEESRLGPKIIITIPLKLFTLPLGKCDSCYEVRTDDGGAGLGLI